MLPLGFEREVDHHDGILLHDADQQNDADNADDVEVHTEEQQREDGAHAGRGQRGEDGDGMNVALIEHAQHDVDGDERGKDEDGLVGERGFKCLGGALEAGIHSIGHAEVGFHLVDDLDGVAQ